MVEVAEEYINIVNAPGRVGTLSTVDAQGRPNVAYFGSPRFHDDGTFTAALTDNRTLKNLADNPYAVFFCVQESPVSFTTPGVRLYLKVREIQKEGERLNNIREIVAQRAGPDAAKMLIAAVTFDVTEVRPLVDMG